MRARSFFCQHKPVHIKFKRKIPVFSFYDCVIGGRLKTIKFLRWLRCARAYKIISRLFAIRNVGSEVGRFRCLLITIAICWILRCKWLVCACAQKVNPIKKNRCCIWYTRNSSLRVLFYHKVDLWTNAYGPRAMLIGITGLDRQFPKTYVRKRVHEKCEGNNTFSAENANEHVTCFFFVAVFLNRCEQKGFNAQPGISRTGS